MSDLKLFVFRNPDSEWLSGVFDGDLYIGFIATEADIDTHYRGRNSIGNNPIEATGRTARGCLRRLRRTARHITGAPTPVIVEPVNDNTTWGPA